MNCERILREDYIWHKNQMYVDHLDQKCIVYLNIYAYNSKIFLKFVSFCKQQSRWKKQFENSIVQKNWLINRSSHFFHLGNLIKVTYVLNTCWYCLRIVDTIKITQRLYIGISCRLRSVLFDIMQHNISKDGIIFSIFPHFFIVSWQLYKYVCN